MDLCILSGRIHQATSFGSLTFFWLLETNIISSDDGLRQKPHEPSYQVDAFTGKRRAREDGANLATAYCCWELLDLFHGFDLSRNFVQVLPYYPLHFLHILLIDILRGQVKFRKNDNNR